MSTILDPAQQLFTRLKLDIEALGYRVYDGVLPPAGTLYPFVYLGEFRTSDNFLKNAVTGSVYATIHVWHNYPRCRGDVAQMLLNIKRVCAKIEYTNNFAWVLRETTDRIMPDSTTKTPLLHGVIDVEFKFS